MTNLTKKAISESFLKLLKSKALGDITVKDIVNDCGVNRKTFYYYYSDIYALADELFEASVSEICEGFINGSLSYFDAALKYAGYMSENRKITMHVYRTLGYEKMSDIFYKTAVKFFPISAVPFAEKYEVEKKDAELISEYFCFTLASIMTRWIRDGMNTPPDEEINKFRALTDGMLENAFVNAAKLKKGGK